MAKGKKKAAAGDVATNRQARFRYELLEKWEAGLMPRGLGGQVAARGRGPAKDSYATVTDGEVWLHKVHIPPYQPASRGEPRPRPAAQAAPAPARDRPPVGRTHERGLTLVPTRLYFSGPHAKVEIALARGKDLHDKRHAIKDREQKREMDARPQRRPEVNAVSGDSAMAQTMARQPEDLRRILADPRPVEAAAERLRGRPLLLTGTGTSYHAAQQGAWFLRAAGVDARAIESVDAALYGLRRAPRRPAWSCSRTRTRSASASRWWTARAAAAAATGRSCS